MLLLLFLILMLRASADFDDTPHTAATTTALVPTIEDDSFDGGRRLLRLWRVRDIWVHGEASCIAASVQSGVGVTSTALLAVVSCPDGTERIVYCYEELCGSWKCICCSCPGINVFFAGIDIGVSQWIYGRMHCCYC